MPDIPRPPTLPLGVLPATLLRLGPAPARLDRLAALGVYHLELERAGQRIGLAELELEEVAHRVARAGLLPNERTRAFVVAEVLAAQRRDRHQAVAAEPDDGGEEAEALHSGDAGPESLADAAREPGGDVAVDGVALGFHRAALGLADRFGDFRQVGTIELGQAAFRRQVPFRGGLLEVEGIDQRAVHQRGGITPDRRGEVRADAEREADGGNVRRSGVS